MTDPLSTVPMPDEGPRKSEALQHVPESDKAPFHFYALQVHERPYEDDPDQIGDIRVRVAFSYDAELHEERASVHERKYVEHRLASMTDERIETTGVLDLEKLEAYKTGLRTNLIDEVPDWVLAEKGLTRDDLVNEKGARRMVTWSEPGYPTRDEVISPPIWIPNEQHILAVEDEELREGSRRYYAWEEFFEPHHGTRGLIAYLDELIEQQPPDHKDYGDAWRAQELFNVLRALTQFWS